MLTRLHARYDAGSLGEDLVFQAAPAIVGGREFLQENNQLEQSVGALPAGPITAPDPQTSGGGNDDGSNSGGCAHCSTDAGKPSVGGLGLALLGRFALVRGRNRRREALRVQ